MPTSIRMLFFANLFIANLILATIGCTTNMAKSLDQIKPGMDRDDVLEIAGGPKRTFREVGQDHWIYVYYVNNQPWLRDVVFSDGRVDRVTAPQSKDTSLKDLESAKTFEEYEQKVRARQKNPPPTDGEKP